MRFAGRIRRILGARPRLFASVLVACVVFAVLPAAIAAPTRFVIAWDCGAVAFMCLSLTMMARSPEKLRFRAQIEDSSQWAILALMVAATLASLLSIGFVLHDAKQQTGWPAIEHLVLAGSTILLSWFFAHLLFAIHYAHAYYGDDPDDEGSNDRNGRGGGFSACRGEWAKYLGRRDLSLLVRA